MRKLISVVLGLGLTCTLAVAEAAAPKVSPKNSQQPSVLQLLASQHLQYVERLRSEAQTGNGQGILDRKRDGSCKTAAMALKTQDQIRDQKRDGSCKTAAMASKTQDQIRDQKRDGSCKTAAMALKTQDQLRDQKRDGSCKSTTTAFKAQDQTRDRKRDGSCTN